MSFLDAAVRVQRDAFDLDAHVTAAAGETVAVMGPSGAGKSTLLGALAGLTPLSAGEVRLGDRILSTPRGQVAQSSRDTVLLGQDARLFPHLSARENVAFGLRARRMPRAAARARAEELLAWVGLPGTGARLPGQLSGGQQQRVAIARAVAASPRLVLLDEPLTSLDSVTADGIRALLKELLAGTTCVVVTHDASDAVALAERLVVLEAGRVTQQGAVDEVLAAPATPFIAEQARLAGVSSASPATMRWRARVVRIEHTDAGVLVHTAEPPVVCELTREAWLRHPFAEGDEIELTAGAAAVGIPED